MSKKLTTIAILLSSLIAGSAMAAYTGPGVSTTVADAKTAQQAKDGTPVNMTGFIVKSLGDDNYVFRDQNGDEVNVEVDDALLQGINVNESTPIVIIGEVDSDWNDQSVDVDTITLVPQTIINANASNANVNHNTVHTANVTK